MQRRWTWLLVLAGTVIIAVAAVAYFAERQAGSPTGSLAALSKAARHGDWDAVETYVDVDAVASQIARSRFAVATGGDPGGEAPPEAGGAMGAGESPAAMEARMSTVYVDNFRTILQERVEAGIERGTAGVEGVLVAGRAKHVEHVSDTEVRATIEVPVDDDGTAEIIVTMVRVDDHWQIIALENLDDDALSTE